MSRPVITGMGVLTPLGLSLEETWERLLKNHSGIVSLDPVSFPDGNVSIAGPLPEFDPGRFLTEKEVRRWDPFMWYAAWASLAAVAHAGLKPETLRNNPRVGLIMGSSRGGIRTLTHEPNWRSSARRISPFLMSSTTPYMAAAASAIKLEVSGPSLGISSACTSGTLALIEACGWITSERQDIVIAGGTDAALCPMALAGYDAAGVLSRHEVPAAASRPFDAGRSGFVLSEGAAVLVLESAEHARDRGAKIYGSIVGTGHTTSPYHEMRPDPHYASRAILAALAQADLKPEEVSAVNAHATSTILGDAAEAKALHLALGSWGGRVPVTANKSQTGHMLAASGPAEAAIALCSLEHGILPPTINQERPDPQCGLNVVTEPRAFDGDCILSTTFGFGGSNAVLLLRRQP